MAGGRGHPPHTGNIRIGRSPQPKVSRSVVRWNDTEQRSFLFTGPKGKNSMKNECPVQSCEMDLDQRVRDLALVLVHILVLRKLLRTFHPSAVGGCDRVAAL